MVAPRSRAWPRLLAQRQLAAGALLVVDRSLETLFQTLDAAGMTDDTLLFFGSDNGGLTGFGGSNYPLRGEKLTLFEGGVRVPMFAYWKGKIAPKVIRRAVSALDLTATIAHAAGMKVRQPLA